MGSNYGALDECTVNHSSTLRWNSCGAALYAWVWTAPGTFQTTTEERFFARIKSEW